VTPRERERVEAALLVWESHAEDPEERWEILNLRSVLASAAPVYGCPSCGVAMRERPDAQWDVQCSPPPPPPERECVCGHAEGSHAVLHGHHGARHPVCLIFGCLCTGFTLHVPPTPAVEADHAANDTPKPSPAPATLLSEKP
jgi:hypothetical protein